MAAPQRARVSSNRADTIFALATPMGRSGVAMVRVSGPRALESLERLSGRKVTQRSINYAVFAEDVSCETSQTIDHGVANVFIAPASYTGENVVEYNLHGGVAIINHMLEALGRMDGLRMAEPGEFTRRAFENGKLDLTEAEAVADLIDAETSLQKSQALNQIGGALSRLYHGWAERLTKSLAYIEADMEFPDEDMPDGVTNEVLPVLEEIKSQIADHLDDNRRGERLRDGIHVAVIGAPNAGKSTLVNALAQRDVAIVSDMAGTTRDVIEVHLNIGGYPIILSDTAGLRPDQIGAEGHEGIESEGIRRALKRAKDADIKLLVFDANEPFHEDTLALYEENAVIVLNKVDEINHQDRQAHQDTIRKSLGDLGVLGGSICIVSARDEIGLNQLTQALLDKASHLIGNQDTPSLTRQRHRSAVEECVSAIDRAMSAALPELRGEDVRLAVRALGRITGRVDVEDLLDVIFKDFCIGK